MRKLLIIFILIFTSVPVIAKDGAEVLMGGYLLFRIRCGNNYLTAQQRADVIQERVNKLLSRDDFDCETMLEIRKYGTDAVIYADGKVLVHVDKKLGELNGESANNLAMSFIL